MKSFFWKKASPHTSGWGREMMLQIKRNINLPVVNIRLLHYQISQINMISTENLLYPSTEQAVNKTISMHIEKIYT